MADQTIICTDPCTITLVHEANIPLLNLTLEQASQLMVPIVLVLCVAWGFRALLRIINTPDNTSFERDSHD